MSTLAKIAIGSALLTYITLTHLSPYTSQLPLPVLLRPTGTIKTFLIFFLQGFSWFVFYKVILYPHFLSPLRHLPGPKRISIWNGQFKKIYRSHTGEPQATWINEVPNDGLIRYLGFLNVERLIVTNAKTLQELLHAKSYAFEKPELLRSNIGAVLGDRGMLFVEGEEHKVQRRHMLPAFSYKHLKGLVPKFWEKAVELAECFEREIRAHQGNGEVDGGAVTIDVTGWFSRATLDIIGSTGFGYDFDTLRDNDSELVRAYRTVFSPVSPKQQLLRLVATRLPRWVMRWIPSERRKIMMKGAQKVRGLCMRMVREKKRELELGGKTGETDILSLTTKDSPFSEEVMRDQLMTFLAAGHETTASALVLAVYMLSLHPNIQNRLRAEIRSYFLTSSSLSLSHLFSSTTTPSSGSPSLELLDSMPYLRAVTLEILRLLPPVPITMRCASEDTTLAGHFVPKGTQVMICPWGINRSKKVWGEDAEVFDPERWMSSPSGQNQKEKDGAGGVSLSGSNYDYMTFLHGPRGCIGKDFARLELKAILVACVGRFEFMETLDEEGKRRNVVLMGGLTVKPVGGMPLSMKIAPSW